MVKHQTQQKKRQLRKKDSEKFTILQTCKVKQHAERYERADVEKDKKIRRKLREPLKIAEKVLVLAERLKKKDVPGNLYKSTTQNISFFNHEQVFIVRKIVKISNIYHYWISCMIQNCHTLVLHSRQKMCLICLTLQLLTSRRW